MQITWKWMKATILHCKVLLGRGQPVLIRWILLWIILLVQGRSIDLLTSSPTCYNPLYHGPPPPLYAYAYGNRSTMEENWAANLYAVRRDKPSIESALGHISSKIQCKWRETWSIDIYTHTHSHSYAHPSHTQKKDIIHELHHNDSYFSLLLG